MPKGQDNSKPWFRFYVDAISDPKVQGLPLDTFKAWINLMCVHARYPDSNVSDSDMAWRLRLTDEEWKASKAILIAADMVTPGNKPTYKGFDVCSLRPTPAEWRIIRQRIFKRDDYTCQYCQRRGVSLQCDHVIPVTRGGGHSDDNLVTACKPCNQAKRDKIVSIAEWSIVRRASSA